MNYPLLIIGIAGCIIGWWLMISGMHAGWLKSRLVKCQRDIINIGPITNPIAKSELRKQLAIEHQLLMLITLLNRLINRAKNNE